MELKMAFHGITGRRIVEVYDNSGEIVACIYPDEATNGINIVSKCIATFDIDSDDGSTDPLPAMTVKFLRARER